MPEAEGTEVCDNDFGMTLKYKILKQFQVMKRKESIVGWMLT